MKSKIDGKLRGLTLKEEECIHNINDPNFIFQIYSSDIKYIIKLQTNNNEIKTKDKIILFGNKERFLLLNKENYEEFLQGSYRDKEEKKESKLKKS